MNFKKTTLNIILILLLPFLSFAQDVVILKHTNYTSYFSKSKKYPLLVEWVLRKEMVGCPTPLKRKDNFKPDPLLPNETDLLNDYIKSGFDRGHNMPAADNLCQTPKIQDECFYFSNITPQMHRLNAGDWKSLEVAIRAWVLLNGDIKIWSGSIGEIKKIGGVSVPEKCWKVLYIKSLNRWMAFMFNNDQSDPDGFQNNEVDKTLIESKTGFQFK